MTVELNRITLWAVVRTIQEQMSSTTANNYLRIYQGTPPTDADDYTVAGSSSDLLATFNDFTLTQSANNYAMLTFNQAPNPSTVNASATGTAAWFAVNVSDDTTKTIIGDVTDETGNGSVRLDSVSLTSGNPVSIVNLTYIFV